MDESPDLLAQTVREKRVAIDNDLELLRVRLRRVDPRSIDARRVARTAVPVIAGAAAVWMWVRRRHAVDSLERLLVHILQELYGTEQAHVPALATMRARASNPDLTAAFEQHRLETETHVDRLERVFRSLRARPRRNGSDIVESIADEGERLLKARVDADVRDAWLIATAQRIEHQEIAGYGTARAYAETLGYTFAADLLQQTLEEERAADAKLTSLAERFVNNRAR